MRETEEIVNSSSKRKCCKVPAILDEKCYRSSDRSDAGNRGYELDSANEVCSGEKAEPVATEHVAAKCSDIVPSSTDTITSAVINNDSQAGGATVTRRNAGKYTRKGVTTSTEISNILQVSEDAVSTNHVESKQDSNAARCTNDEVAISSKKKARSRASKAVKPSNKSKVSDGTVSPPSITVSPKAVVPVKNVDGERSVSSLEIANSQTDGDSLPTTTTSKPDKDGDVQERGKY